MKTKIHEVEIAFSNACTADCAICSRTHGGINEPYMSREVFNKVWYDLLNIDVSIIQTGGDGDSFINPIYIDSLRRLKASFPTAKIVLYSNFALFDRGFANCIVSENLLDNVYTRIDTLNPPLFQEFTGLDFYQVKNNIKYFISINKKISFQINYSNIHSYKRKCKEILNIDRPIHWRDCFDSAPKDEYDDIMKFFNMPRTSSMLSFSRITHSLWAERSSPAIVADTTMQCGRQYCFDQVMYIWPNGNVGICGYDDGQDTLIYGNVMNTPLIDLWNSPERQAAIEKVRTRAITTYPCINPRACLFY